jgi:hypothetical protein
LIVKNINSNLGSGTIEGYINAVKNNPTSADLS